MIRVFLDRLYLFSGYLAGLFLIAIFVLMMLLSGGRPLGINIPAGDDFISWCMAATAFLGLAHTFKQGVIAVPLWIPQLGYSGGIVILFIAFVDELVHVLRGFAPRYELPKPQSAEEVVERAMQSGV